MTRKEFFQQVIKQADEQLDVAPANDEQAADDYADKFTRALIDNFKIDGLED